LDMIIHGIVGVSYKDCPGTWKFRAHGKR
jgi:hypothetical protein